MSPRHSSLRGARGQALVEYVVVAAIVGLLLVVATDGQDSMLHQFLQAIGTAWEKYLAALSLPQ